MICILLGIKLFYLLIYERVDLLLVILFTVVTVVKLSVDPSLIFKNFFVISSSLLFFVGMHSVFCLQIDALWLELSNCRYIHL